MNDSLFYAILSMDAYNRSVSLGTSVSLELPSSAADGLGSATLAGASDVPSDSFFAQAYNWQGKVVISYRGTDHLLSDLATGWGVGAGIYNSPQAHDAAQFFQ